jgi:hypothetical protein
MGVRVGVGVATGVALLHPATNDITTNNKTR